MKEKGDVISILKIGLGELLSMDDEGQGTSRWIDSFLIAFHGGEV
jgi:hypothetical protein